VSSASRTVLLPDQNLRNERELLPARFPDAEAEVQVRQFASDTTPGKSWPDMRRAVTTQRDARRGLILVKGVILAGIVLAVLGVSMPAASGSQGWLVACPFSHSLPDDPIVYPGQPGMSHMHDFFGTGRPMRFRRTSRC
jgi:hypothetical protein